LAFVDRGLTEGALPSDMFLGCGNVPICLGKTLAFASRSGSMFFRYRVF
jgi:hypothetical protein